jgi:hypothetical protein
MGHFDGKLKLSRKEAEKPMGVVEVVEGPKPRLKKILIKGDLVMAPVQPVFF